GDGQALEGNRAYDHRQDGDDHRNDWAANEEVSHNAYSLAGLASGCCATDAVAASAAVMGFTIAPSRTFCRPSTTMRSPGLSPSRISTLLPMVSPTFTARWLVLLSEPTTHTKL